VRAAGVEPANWVFSSLLMVAFPQTYLRVIVRHYQHDCKCFLASLGNKQWKTLCRAVSGFGLVSILCHGWILCQSCVSPSCQSKRIPRKTATLPSHGEGRGPSHGVSSTLRRAGDFGRVAAFVSLCVGGTGFEVWLWRALPSMVHCLTVWVMSSKAAKLNISAPAEIFMRLKSLGNAATSYFPSRSSE